jgi:hypothetical protein
MAEAEQDNKEYYIAIIDGVRYLQEVSNEQDQENQNVPVGGVPMQAIASEAPQVSISTVEADKAAASQMAESGGQVANRPVPTTPSREATEDPSSLTEDPLTASIPVKRERMKRMNPHVWCLPPPTETTNRRQSPLGELQATHPNLHGVNDKW